MLRLCRDIWHCPPSVVREQKPSDVLEALATLTAENQALAMKQRTDGWVT